MHMNHTYKLRWSREVAIITGVVLVLTGSLVVPFFFDTNGNEVMLAVFLGGGIILTFVALGYCALQSPVSYTMDSEGLHLKTFGGIKHFTWAEYDIVSNLEASIELRHSVRLFGSGGFFGYLGTFSVPDRGTCRLYLTSRKGAVMRLRHKHTGKYTYITQGV